MQLAACANGVRMGCLAGCPRSCGAVRARRSSAASWSSIIVLALTGNLGCPDEIVPDNGFHLPGSGAKLITHIKGANHRCCLTQARLGGDLACQPVAPIKAYASQSVRAGGHGHAQGLRRCSWAGVRRAITAKVRSTGCGLTSAWPSAPGKHAPRSLNLPLGLPDRISVRPREKSLTKKGPPTPTHIWALGLWLGETLSAVADSALRLT